MAKRDIEAMSREELLEEVWRLKSTLANDDVLRATIHDLEVYRDELHASHAELSDSQSFLEQSRDAYAALFDFAPIGYVILDGRGVVTDLNLTVATLLGAERARLIGYPFFSLVAPQHRRRSLDYLRRCRQTTRGGLPRQASSNVEIELDLRRRDGQLLPVLLTTKGINRSSSALLSEFHVAITDLRERRQLEGERRRLEEERGRADREQEIARAESVSKDHFIAILSHELRTPLAPIRFAVASLRRAGGLSDALRHALDIIDRSVEHEARMIEDLLDVTRIAQKKLHLTFVTVDVHKIIQEVVMTHAPELEHAGIQVAVELRAVARYVRGDEGRLRQVLVNLLRNACANTPAQGHVLITTTNPAPDRVAISVRDDGRGIDPAVLSRLFRPFEQRIDPERPSTGLGLGLSICKGIVEGHEGRITAASDGLGTGATFTVEFPARVAEAVSRPVAAPALLTGPDASSKPGAVRVLLVEDNLDSAESMAALLEMSGYRVNVASSVQAALRAADQEFDVLVSDIGLPDGTGRDLIRELATRRPVRGIALTGYGTAEDVIKNTRAGFMRHLVKPVNPDKLVAAIDELARAPFEGTTDAAAGQRRR